MQFKYLNAIIKQALIVYELEYKRVNKLHNNDREEINII